MSTGKIHLVIPDAHATPESSNRRFDWLGNAILDIRPDVIVDIGDFADMASLCSYDFGKKSFEGRRIKEDIEVTLDAQERCFGVIKEYNSRRSILKKRQYNPRIIRCVGNHEQRIHKAIDGDAKLEGILSFDMLQYDKYGEVYPFLKPAVADGVFYSHFFASGVMNRPIDKAHLLLQKKHVSCTQGHAHTRDWAEDTTYDPATGKTRKIQGLVCGSYLDPEYYASYAGQQVNKMWWSGLIIKRNVRDGQYDLEFVSVDEVQRRWS
jgi:hypothetical protein